MSSANTVITQGNTTATVAADGSSLTVANGANSIAVDASTNDVSITAGTATVTIDGTTGNALLTVGQNSVAITAATGDIVVNQAGPTVQPTEPTTPPDTTTPPADTGTTPPAGGGTTPPTGDGAIPPPDTTTPPADTTPPAAPVLNTPAVTVDQVNIVSLTAPWDNSYAINTASADVIVDFPANSDAAALSQDIPTIGLTANVQKVVIHVVNSSADSQLLDLESSAGLIDGGVDSGTRAAYTIPAGLVGTITVISAGGVIYAGPFTTSHSITAGA